MPGLVAAWAAVVMRTFVALVGLRTLAALVAFATLAPLPLVVGLRPLAAMVGLRLLAFLAAGRTGFLGFTPPVLWTSVVGVAVVYDLRSLSMAASAVAEKSVIMVKHVAVHQYW